MGQFLKFILATIIGLFIFSFLIVMLFIAVISSASSGSDNVVSDNSILKIKINKNIEERESDDFFGSLSPFDANEGGTIGLLNLRQAIKHAKGDNKIKGIFLELHNTQTGFATLEELRNTLLDFKKSGKYVIAYSESYSEGSYYLASVADKIFLPNSGEVEINGLNMELLYFKGTLEKLQIKPEVFKVGTYKSAVEPFILDQMSEANRLQLKSFLNSIYDEYLRNVAKSRGIDEKFLKEISQSMLVRNSDDALKYKIVTDLGYYDNVEEYLRTKLGLGKNEKIKYISYPKYDANLYKENDSEDEDKDIAVVFASGAIEQGMGNAETIGSEKIAGEIRKARLNDKVKAIVLRINSPGGSALASDIIWREVMLARKDKPIIASMSDLAASGGYYIAMACDTIVANKTTITGSIGVFGLLFNGKDFLKDKLGITSDREKTGKYSDIITFTRELTDDERAIVQEEVERIYGDFTQKAADGRKMNVDSLRKIAEGRVWSGIEGKQNGLVDLYGGLDEAIAVAAKKAGLKEGYTTGYFPEQKNLFLKELFTQLGGEDEGAAFNFNSEFSKFYPYIKTIKDLEKMEGIQARLPYEIIIK
jgi:protease-4